MKTLLIQMGGVIITLFLTSNLNAQSLIFNDTILPYQALTQFDSIWGLVDAEQENDSVYFGLPAKQFYYGGYEIDSVLVVVESGLVQFLTKSPKVNDYLYFTPLGANFRHHYNREPSSLRIHIDSSSIAPVLYLEFVKFRTCDYNGFYTEVDLQLKFYGKQQRIEYHYGPYNYRAFRYAHCNNYWRFFTISYLTLLIDDENQIHNYDHNYLVGNPDSVEFSPSIDKIDTIPRLGQVYSFQYKREPYLDITESNNSSLDIRLHPNPSSSYSTLEGLERGSGVAVYNALGQVLEGVWDGNQTLNWQGLPAGFYFVEIYHKGQKEVLKVLVTEGL